MLNKPNFWPNGMLNVASKENSFGLIKILMIKSLPEIKVSFSHVNLAYFGRLSYNDRQGKNHKWNYVDKLIRIEFLIGT